MSESTRRLETPPIFSPTELRVHPDVALIRSRSLTWCEAMGLFEDPGQRQRSTDTDSAYMICIMVPLADRERVQLFSDWGYWAYAWDDYLDLAPARDHARTSRVATTAWSLISAMLAPGSDLLPGSPHQTAIADVSERFQAISSASQLRRYHNGMIQSFASHPCYIAIEAGQVPPTVDQYMAVAKSRGFGPAVEPFLEVTNKLSIPAAELDMPAFRAFSEAMYLAAQITNDVMSFNKERVGDESDWNLILAFAAEQGLSLEAARDAALAIRDRMICRAQTLADTSLAKVSQDARAYVTGVFDTLRSVVEHHSKAPRYVDSGRGEVTDTPSDSSTEAPPISSIRWWWDRDL
ncbi:terpene synthase family protein [Streptomyces sp. NPDC001667]